MKNLTDHATCNYQELQLLKKDSKGGGLTATQLAMP